MCHIAKSPCETVYGRQDAALKEALRYVTSNAKQLRKLTRRMQASELTYYPV